MEKKHWEKHWEEHKIYVLDRYTSRYFELEWISQENKEKEKLNIGDFIVYSTRDKKLSIWKYIGHSVDTDRTAQYVRKLEGKEKDFFDEQQKLALKIFPVFKKDFKKTFEWSKPVTARYHIFSDQLYLYFYSEERYVFTEFVRKFRSKIWKNLFLFQVGARDMVRLSHVVDQRLDINGRPLHYSYTRQLPSIEMEDVVIQWLEWRDIERLKDRSGKLKCSLSYEVDLYKKESKKYPPKGAKVESKKLKARGFVLSYNIMNGDVTIKTEKNEILRIPVSLLTRVK